MFFYEHALLKNFNSAYLYVIPIVKTLCRLEISFDLKIQNKQMIVAEWGLTFHHRWSQKAFYECKA